MDVHSNVGCDYEIMGDRETLEFSWALFLASEFFDHQMSLSLLCPIVIILGSASTHREPSMGLLYPIALFL